MHGFKLILVDEFQDLSNSRAELLKEMLSQSPDIRLFAVGDDWQSIYRFAGSDISAMTEFQKQFGYTAVNYLTRTFRCNNGIAQTAAEFISKNPAQIRKNIRAEGPQSKGVVEIAFYPDDPEPLVEQKLRIVAEYAKRRGVQYKVLFLGRYNFLRPEKLAEWAEMHAEQLELQYMTVHRSKGLEADIVFILGATNRPGQNFPSSRQDDPLVNLFMPSGDTFPVAEERRLFYVALTRAKKKVYLITPEGQASSFIVELIQQSEQNAIKITTRQGAVVGPSDVTKPPFRAPLCPQCRNGSMQRKVGKFGPFEVCSQNERCGFRRNASNAPFTRVC